MDYPPIRGEDLPYYAKNATWNLLNTYINAHSQIFIDECPGCGVQSISILKHKCENMTFSDQIKKLDCFRK